MTKVFTRRNLNALERYTIRGVASELLVAHERERVVDMLLRQFEYLAWHQAEALVKQTEQALLRLK
jgi:hypothetical protein